MDISRINATSDPSLDDMVEVCVRVDDDNYLDIYLTVQQAKDFIAELEESVSDIEEEEE